MYYRKRGFGMDGDRKAGALLVNVQHVVEVGDAFAHRAASANKR
jgi:hypothetical protein